MILLSIITQKSSDGIYESVIQLKRNNRKETINIRSKKEIHFPFKALIKGLYQLLKEDLKGNKSTIYNHQSSILNGPCSIDSNGFIERPPIFNEVKDENI